MRVLFLVTGYPCESRPAEGIFHRTACEALVRCGVKVEVLAPVPWVPPGLGCYVEKYREYVLKPRYYVLNEVKVHRPRYVQIPRGDWLGWSHWWYGHVACPVARNGIDVIHAHFSYPCGLAAVRLGRSLGLPVVLTLHGSDVNVFPNVSHRTRRLFCDAVNGVDHVLAVSGPLAGRAKTLAGRLPEVMPIGVDLRKFAFGKSKTECRKQLGIPADKVVVVTVATLIIEKGVRELLAALRALDSQNVVGVILGGGPLLKEVQSVPNVIAVGAVANERVPDYLAAADVFVLPSYSEGMPTVLVEAGAMRLPVVGSAVGGIPELLGDDRGWLIPSRSSEAIVGGISTILADRECASYRASRLYEYVVQYYDADRNARRVVDLYTGLAHCRSERRCD